VLGERGGEAPSGEPGEHAAGANGKEPGEREGEQGGAETACNYTKLLCVFVARCVMTRLGAGQRIARDSHRVGLISDLYPDTEALAPRAHLSAIDAG
jgi:hypothetical protein